MAHNLRGSRTVRTSGNDLLFDSPINLEDAIAAALNVGPSPQEQAGLETLRLASDVTGSLDRARDRFNRFVAPTIESRLVAQGLGRSGAVGEALAKGFAPIAENVEARAFQGAQNLGSAQIGVGQFDRQRLLQFLTLLLSLRTRQANLNASARASSSGGSSFNPSLTDLVARMGAIDQQKRLQESLRNPGILVSPDNPLFKSPVA